MSFRLSAFAILFAIILPKTFAATTPSPVISAFAPGAGAPGTSVTIFGANFIGIREVRFNNSMAIFSVVSESVLAATVPLDATTGPITVTTATGSAATFTQFAVAPRIIGFTPANGAPGAAILIEGANFIGASSVKFNGRDAANFAVSAQNQIHATVPLGATSGPLTVTTAVGTAASPNNFVITGTEPIIDKFSPANGVAGTVVTIEGRNFSGTTAVKFNGVAAANFFITSSTQIRATVPVGAMTGPIMLATAFGTAASPQSFLVSAGPLVTGFSPAVASVGKIIVIDGANFTGARLVRFNGTGTTNFSVTSPSQISAVVPTGATTGPISVTNPSGTGVSAASLIVTAKPVITSFLPTNGPPGTIVVLDGFNFEDSGIAVRFGTKAARVLVVGPTQLSAVVPTGARSGPINVTTLTGTGTSTNDFIVTSDLPIITRFSPTAALPGANIVIEGINFSGATAVKFGETNANFTVTAPTQIIATVPDNALTGPISVTSAAGTAVSNVRFIAAPRIASFSPANGYAGTHVTIRGTNFTDVVAVKFNGATAGFDVLSPNEVMATVPNAATSGVMSVATPAGIVGSTNQFVVFPISEVARLGIQVSRDGTFTLSWPIAAGNYFLQTTAQLAPPISWTSATNSPTILRDKKIVALPKESSKQYFRLIGQ